MAAARALFTPNDLIVTFRPGALGAPPIGAAALRTPERVYTVGAAMRSRLAALVPHGVVVEGVSPAILTAKLSVADATQLDAIAAALRQDPAVTAVTRNHLIWLDRSPYVQADGGRLRPAVTTTTPNNPYYPIQTWNYGLIDLPRAWSLTTGNASVVVGVVDDGIRFDHPSIAANLLSDGRTFVTIKDSLTLCAGGKISNADNGTGYKADSGKIPASYHPDPTGTCYIPDTLGAHGLHVAGTIGAVGNDGIGVTGVNWTVRIRPVRVLGVGGFGESYDVAQGVLYAAGLPADNGAGSTVQLPTGSSPAKVINLSLGGSADDSTLHRAIRSAANAGALIVAAAGNDGTSFPFFPAAYPEVLGVAAVGPDAAPTTYSNFGRDAGIRAPGGNFDLGDASDGVLSTIWNFATNAPTYAWAEGTSMAAPHVSGVAALLLALQPTTSAAAVRSLLTSYAAGPATRYGAGLVNAYNALTQTLGPPTAVYARLYSATTGAIVQSVATQTGGRFTFNTVADGSYFVYGGTDESGDQHLGVPGRLWGALGGSAFPTPITILSAGPSFVSFGIGLPAQVEPNHDTASANVLVIGGYVRGTIVDTARVDVYRVQVPVAGTYTFETAGWVGTCGWALEEATLIGLYSSSGFLTSANYLDPRHGNYCSRLTNGLGAGTYYVAVQGAFTGGRYQLQARAGP